MALIRHNAQTGVEPIDDEDSPNATAIMRKTLAKRRVGRPIGTVKKEQVAVRYDADILEAAPV